MSIRSPHLVVAFLGTLVLGSCEANIWAAFMGNHSHQAAPPVEPGLCSSLVSKMEILNKGTPGTCKPMPDNVSGPLKQFCTTSSAEIANGCDDATCFGEALQSVGSSELLTGCLCHGYLDVYASLWTTWKLVCGESSSNPQMDGRRLKVKNEATFIFKVKGNPGSVGANILLAEEVGHWQGIRIAIGEMENTQSSIYREYGLFSAPLGNGIQTDDIIPRVKAKKFWIRASIEFKGHKDESPLTIDVGRGDSRKPFLSKTFQTCRPIRSIAVAGGQGLSWKYGGDFQMNKETSGHELQFLTDEQEAVMKIHPLFTGLECPSDTPIY